MSGIHQEPRGNFIENTINGLYATIGHAVYADSLAGGAGLLQPIDPRVKLAGVLSLIAAAALSRRLSVIACILIAALMLGVLSRLPLWRAMAPVWIAALTFTGAIALPAIFLTPGDSVYHLRRANWDITAQGLRTAAYLLLRVETSVTLALLLVFTTPWTHALKALRVLRVPAVFVVVLGMTFRYILLLLETTREMFESRKSRTVGKLTRGDYRRLAVSSGAVLLGKTFHLSEEVFLAMQSRGFRGEVYVLDEFRMSARDWAALTLFTAAAATAVWAGR